MNIPSKDDVSKCATWLKRIASALTYIATFLSGWALSGCAFIGRNSLL